MLAISIVCDFLFLFYFFLFSNLSGILDSPLYRLSTYLLFLCQYSVIKLIPHPYNGQQAFNSCVDVVSPFYINFPPM